MDLHGLLENPSLQGIVSYFDSQGIQCLRSDYNDGDLSIPERKNSIYHDIALALGIALGDDSIEDIMSRRGIKYDWLKGVRDWEGYVLRHLALESSWLGDNECRYISRLSDYLVPHRFKIDEKEGTVIFSTKCGAICVEGIEDAETTLWMNPKVSTWAHVEYGGGFLVFTSGEHEIEIWRRASDQLDDPLPSCSPGVSQLEDERECTQASASRGVYKPFNIIRPPKITRATRVVYPTTALVSLDCTEAFLYDLPSAKLIQTIELVDGSSIFYVEVSELHIFLCVDVGVQVYARQTGSLMFTLDSETFKPAVTYAPPAFRPAQARSRVIQCRLERSTRSETYHSISFRAVHVTPCGQNMAALCRNGHLVFVSNFAIPERRIYVFKVNDHLNYLAIDSDHIVFSGGRGIYILNLGRMTPTSSLLSEDPKTHPLLVFHSLMYPMRTLSCLQITATSIWFVTEDDSPDIGNAIESAGYEALKVDTILKSRRLLHHVDFEPSIGL